jgi:hypothetical protein
MSNSAARIDVLVNDVRELMRSVCVIGAVSFQQVHDLESSAKTERLQGSAAPTATFQWPAVNWLLKILRISPTHMHSPNREY